MEQPRDPNRDLATISTAEYFAGEGLPPVEVEYSVYISALMVTKLTQAS